MDPRCEVLVLGIGNLLWADEGFGVRAVEALHAAYEFPAAVTVKDGGTLGLNLYERYRRGQARAGLRRDRFRAGARNACACCAAPRCRRGDAPGSRRTRSASTTCSRLAYLNGCAPESIVAIGVQPVELDDFGGSLREPVRARLAEAVALAADELAAWGFPGTRRAPGARFDPLNARRARSSTPTKPAVPPTLTRCRSAIPALLAPQRAESD